MMPIFSTVLNLCCPQGKGLEVGSQKQSHQRRWLSLGLLLVIALGSSVAGCTGPTQTSDTPPAAVEPATPSSPNAPQSTNTKTTLNTLKFKQGSGAEAFSLKVKADGAKLVDPANAELARITVDDGQKVKIKNAQDQPLGYVVKNGDHWKVEDAEQSKTLYVLRRQADGDYKLEDGQDQPIYRVKVRDYGFEIETPNKQSLYKVKVKEGKTSLRNAKDETMLSTKDAIAPIAFVAFGFDVLTPEQRAALAYAVNLTGGQ